MSSSDEYKDLKPDERRFVERIVEHYTPHPLSPTQRAAFDRTLEERLAASSRLPFLRPAGILVSACAALLLWLALPSQKASHPNFEDLSSQSAPVVAQNLPASQATSVTHAAGTQEATAHANLLTYAYYQSESYADEEGSGETHILPDEYIALADAFELL